MKIKVDAINVIGVFLAAVYIISFGFFYYSYQSVGSNIYIVFYLCLFLLLSLSAIAVVFLSEFGRKMLIGLNIVLFVSLIAKYLMKLKMLDVTFIPLSIISFLYFNEKNIKGYFCRAKKIDWKSILVVDDDEMIIKMLRPILMRNGYSVLVAQNGDDGLRIARTQKPDLVMLDVILPGIKGRDVCKIIKEDEETKDIPVIFLTAKDSPEDVQAEKDVGGEAHLTKPINTKKLLETVKDILKSNKDQK